MANTGPNPYSLHKLWSPEVHQAYLSMPKNNLGYVIALQYLEPREALRMEPLWKEWCQSHPKNLWPLWIFGWKDYKRLNGISAA